MDNIVSIAQLRQQTFNPPPDQQITAAVTTVLVHDLEIEHVCSRCRYPCAIITYAPFTCAFCQRTNVVPLRRFKVQAAVEDQSGRTMLALEHKAAWVVLGEPPRFVQATDTEATIYTFLARNLGSTVGQQFEFKIRFNRMTYCLIPISGFYSRNANRTDFALEIENAINQLQIVAPANVPGEQMIDAP